MGQTTAIEWTDHTFNIVWGCTKVSAACTRCYAETFSRRLGLKIWGQDAPRRTFGEKHWREPIKWNAVAQRAGVRRRVFCSSMADVFEDHPTVAEERLKLWPLIEATPWLDWLLLTKRPENISLMLPPEWGGPRFPVNIWLGTTAENQEMADQRIPALSDVPVVASVRFISAEPLLGPIGLSSYLRRSGRHDDSEACPLWYDGCNCPPVDWVIAGAESGHGARPMNEDWVRSLRDQCRTAGAAFFYKQRLDERGRKIGTPELDGNHWTDFPGATP